MRHIGLHSSRMSNTPDPSRNGQEWNLQTVRNELHAALAFLSSPPKDAFADIGGAPQEPSHEQAIAARQWQWRALELLHRMQELMHSIIEHGALQALDRQAAVHHSSSAAASEPVWVTSTSFWQDITSVAAANGNSSSTMIKDSKSSAPAGADSGRPLDAQHGHGGHGRSLLIEELDSSEAAEQQSADHIKRGGVVIEELGSEEGNDQPGKPCNSKWDSQLTSESSTLSLLFGRLLPKLSVLSSAAHVMLRLSHCCPTRGLNISSAQQGDSPW